MVEAAFCFQNLALCRLVAHRRAKQHRPNLILALKYQDEVSKDYDDAYNYDIDEHLPNDS